MIIVAFSDDEATALNRLLDLAVRQGGLQVAPMASIINQKLVDAFKTHQEPAHHKPNGEGVTAQ